METLKFQVDCLRDKNIGDLTNDLDKAMAEVIEALYDSQVGYNAQTKTLQQVKKAGNTMPLDQMRLSLKDSVFFVDEAVPQFGSGPQAFEEALDFLRFVRNLGRALEMRVITAGTAASAANLLAESLRGSVEECKASRSGEAEMGWGEVVFLWRPIKEGDLKKALGVPSFAILDGLFAQLLKERPLVFEILRKAVRKERQSLSDTKVLTSSLLQAIGRTLKNTKSILVDATVIWMTGAWLEGGYVTPSAYLMQAPELVKNHFFEPAITVVAATDKPYLGKGLGFIHRKSSPLRVYINRCKGGKKDIWWSVSVSDDPQGEPQDDPQDAYPCFTEENSSLALGFPGVEYSLTHCVQQCLAREPILAVSLSTICGDLRSEVFLVQSRQSFRKQRFSIQSVRWAVRETGMSLSPCSSLHATAMLFQ